MASIIAPLGPSESRCGYCHSTNPTSHTFGLWAYKLSVEDYQVFLDKGFRRSGHYLYKPDFQKTCCPAYSIRLKAVDYEFSKTHKKCIKKVAKYSDLLDEPLEDKIEPHQKTMDKSPNKYAVETTMTSPLAKSIHDSLISNKSLSIITAPAQYTDEVYQLYHKYQTTVHSDKPSDVSKNKFKQFLVNTPLIPFRNNHITYGSMYQKYYIKKKLIACAVIDILPSCVSSVYFMYDPDYSSLSLGTYSCLNEIAYTQNLSLYSDVKYYYLGYYIHSCPKMRYKSQYKPSFLLCPETFVWKPVSVCEKFLDNDKVCVLGDIDVQTTQIRHSVSVSKLNKEALSELFVYSNGCVVALKNFTLSNEQIENTSILYSFLGSETIKRLILVF